MAEIRKKVDSAWKQKAAKEKLALERKVQKKKEREAGQDGRPRPGFRELVATFAAQAEMALSGDPRMGGRRDMAGAQYVLDMLELIEEKTEGNLDEEESQVLQQVLSQLRMVFEQPG